MPNLVKKLPSGATLEVSMAPFQVGNTLLKSVMKEAESVQINVGFKGKSLQELFSAKVTDEVINTLKNAVARLIASESVEQALWPCMSRATYNQVKITPETFESELTRMDYLVVAKEVLVYNLSPFLSSLGSLSTVPKAEGTHVRK